LFGGGGLRFGEFALVAPYAGGRRPGREVEGADGLPDLCVAGSTLSISAPSATVAPGRTDSGCGYSGDGGRRSMIVLTFFERDAELSTCNLAISPPLMDAVPTLFASVTAAVHWGDDFSGFQQGNVLRTTVASADAD